MFKRLLQSKYFISLIFIALFGAIFYILIEKNGGVEGIKIFREKYQIISMAIFIPIQVILSVSPFPSETVAFASSILLGFKLGCFVNWFAWVISAIVEYSLVKNTLKDIDIADKELAKLPNWLRKFPASSPWFLILGLWFPFGSHIVCTVAASKNVDIVKFIICTAIGYIPFSIFVAALANGFIQI